MKNDIIEPEGFVPRAGALRCAMWDTHEFRWRYRCANPGDVWYSTVIMLATEFYTADGAWKKIHED